MPSSTSSPGSSGSPRIGCRCGTCNRGPSDPTLCGARPVCYGNSSYDAALLDALAEVIGEGLKPLTVR